MTEITAPQTDTWRKPDFILGLVFIVLSAGTFILSEGKAYAPDLFFINYIFSVVYFFIVAIGGLVKYGGIARQRIDYTLVLLVLWMISAFALNREYQVFEKSAGWLSVALIISAVTVLSLVVMEKLPYWLIYIIFFLLGCCSVIFLYFSIFMLPFYFIGFLGIIALGVTLHIFIPASLLFASITVVSRASRANVKLVFTYLCGVAVSVIIAVTFLVSWSRVNSEVTFMMNSNTLTDADLPSWVTVSQRLEKSALTEKFLKTDLVYTAYQQGGSWWGLPQRNFNAIRQHDPLVMFATMFNKMPVLDERERINILKSQYDSRHEAEERLWSGDQLETATVISNVRLYPSFRMAYTEKILTVRNNTKQRWRPEQEALYTFHLTEGSVVTSLSLWIDGKEEKGVLTTKAKADTAYKTIVGVQQRDPSVIHWQEGNVVTVRVFPCLPGDNRKFKIGVTSPLRKAGERLVYENIYFDGPMATDAAETVQLQVVGNPDDLAIPEGFSPVNGNYLLERDYEPYWEISCKAATLAKAGFSFSGRTYQVDEYRPEKEAFAPSEVYLDLNSAWSREEVAEVVATFKATPIFVFHDGLVRVTDNNLDKLYEDASELNFSLFPIYAIRNPGKALFISKSTGSSPSLQDLKKTAFADKLAAYIAGSGAIRMFELGTGRSPYLKALTELRALHAVRGTIQELQKLATARTFVKWQENDNVITIPVAGLTISEGEDVLVAGAPDHVLRLFVYNKIMKKLGRNYFKDDYTDPATLEDAQLANVVSPVSSLIVLERQADYDNFDIKKNKNGLGNASMKSDGAVPEPHEWALIVLALTLMSYLLLKDRMNIRWRLF